MKITRPELKLIVKECLIEILQDGLGSDFSTSETVGESKKVILPQQRTRQSQQSSIRQHTQERKTIVPENVVGVAKNLLNEIFEDTAKTTYKNFVNNDRTGHSQVEHVDALPEEIFGKSVVDSWESLAFD